MSSTEADVGKIKRQIVMRYPFTFYEANPTWQHNPFLVVILVLIGSNSDIFS
ncbi:MAG: hypothetical protein HMLIMOIP_002589 [Candidatus Nitrosomirales archaeon]|jgi:hypothetical protein